MGAKFPSAGPARVDRDVTSGVTALAGRRTPNLVPDVIEEGYAHVCPQGTPSARLEVIEMGKNTEKHVLDEIVGVEAFARIAG